MNQLTSSPTTALACEACRRLPHPPRLRLTLAKLAAVFPIELGAHAFFLHHHLSYLTTVALLAVTATVLVIWVVEPSATRLLGGWLHARAVRDHHRLHGAPALWRIRTAVPDRPGALGRLSGALAELDVNILGVDVQPGPDGVLDELVVSAPHERTAPDLLDAVARGGGAHTQVRPTSAMALADAPTRALDLAVRVAREPDRLPGALAQLVRAEPVDPGTDLGGVPAAEVLKVPWHAGGALVLVRPGEEFTPGERARAQRLAELAEQVSLAGPRV
jgi:hypothetical protein